MMLRRIRILSMFVLLFIVAGTTWLSGNRTMHWDRSLWVAVYPIAGDNSPRTQKYVQELRREDFGGVERFFERQARIYGIDLVRPLSVHLYEPLASAPPSVPESENPFYIAAWSLRMKFWAWRSTRGSKLPTPDIKMFLVLHDPSKTTTVAHSLGLRNGLLGIVNGFASRRQQTTNNVVVAHELMHTLGATDKYVPGSNYPMYPDGFANPNQYPPLPQSNAEIMGGRIPLNNEIAVMPRGLKSVVVGELTAHEIGWR